MLEIQITHYWRIKMSIDEEEAAQKIFFPYLQELGFVDKNTKMKEWFDFNYCEGVFIRSNSWEKEESTYETINYKWCLQIPLCKFGKWPKIKKIKKSWLQDSVYNSMFTILVDKEDKIKFLYKSYYFPYLDLHDRRTLDDIKDMPDCFDMSSNSTSKSDYRPWVFSNSLNKDLKFRYISSKLYDNVEDVKKMYDFETREIERCIPIAEQLTNEFNKAVKESRKYMHEAVVLRNEANKKVNEAKQLIIDTRQKLYNTYLKKENIKKEFENEN